MPGRAASGGMGEERGGYNRAEETGTWPRVTLTYQDYLELPDDGKHCQIINVRLYVTPAPGRSHQGTLGTSTTSFAAMSWITRSGCCDVILDESTIVQPDLLFIDHERLEMLTDRGMEGPPTLVVEILSPATNRIDRVRKLRTYAKHGVPNYCIVDPQTRYIEAHELTGREYELTGYLQGTASGPLPPFPDLTIRLVDVWS